MTSSSSFYIKYLLIKRGDNNMRLTTELKNIEYYNEVMYDLLEKSKIPSNRFDYEKILKNVDNCTYEWKPPRRILIPKSDGKSYREIFMFNENDSILQKIITKIINYKKYDLIDDSVYSYKKGISIFTVAREVKASKKELIFAKMDISNYFLSINKETINNSIDVIFAGDLKGKKLIRDLFSVNSYIDGKTGERVERFLSIIPGCALSSFMANYVLGAVDSIMNEKCDFYSRYSDDILIGADSKLKLEYIERVLSDKLKELGLSINPKKTIYFNKNDNIEYLGLEISDSRISLSKSNMKILKTLIKSICKEQRKNCEINKGNPVDYVIKAIKIINGKLYRSVFDTAQNHKGNRAVFIFHCITDIDQLRQLDFYIRDRLNYVFSGKNNSKVYLNKKELTYMRYLSLTYMYSLFKKDRDIFLWKCWGCNNDEYILSHFKSRKCIENPYITGYMEVKSINELIGILFRPHTYIYNEGSLNSGKDLRIDYINKSISVRNLLIIDQGVLVNNTITIMTEGEFTNLRLNITYSKPNVNPEITKQLYLQFCAGNSMGCNLHYNYTRKLRPKDLINLYNDVKLDFVKPEIYCAIEFHLYLFYVSLYNLWEQAGFVNKEGFRKYHLDILVIVLPDNL